MKRVSLLILLSAILALTACTGEPGQGVLDGPGPEAEAIPGRPTIQMNADSTAYVGLEGAYCWFQAANDIRCEPGPLDPAPEDVARVMPGDVLTFTVGGDSAPSRVTAALLDDLDESGQPVEISLGSETAADYEVDLDAGLHRIAVVAEFAATETDTNFITTIFAVDVEAAVALEPTEVPTEMPPAATDTPPATDEPTATDMPTEVPTEEPAETEEATPEPAAILPATEAPTAVPPTLPPTVPPTLPPTLPPTAVPPSPVPSPTRVAPTALPPTAPPAADSYLEDIVPEVVIVKGDNRYEPVGVEFCVADAEDCQTLIGSAPDAQITLAQGDTVRIDLAEGGPTRMAFLLTDTAQTRVLEETALRGNTVGLYTVTAGPGTYLLLIRTEWPDALATYYFRLQITG